ncbi:Double zinc ribbon [Ruminococcaceae bacterium FB2012]|nr:Double zinc ribbon [Ruminococcaceae bacterium FB2012]
MPFCSKCGFKVQDGEIFCEICGNRIRTNTERTARQSSDSSRLSKPGKIYEGNRHTCLHCGEIINSFATLCPSCGAEIRDTESSRALEKFYNDLQRARDDKAKISLIRTFPIPNSREDICEFMYLAASNFDAKLYIANRDGDSLHAAWYSQIEKCYHKAVHFPGGTEKDIIMKLYGQIQEKVKQAESNKSAAAAAPWILIAAGIALTVTKVKYLSYAGVIMLIIGIALACVQSDNKKEEKAKKAAQDGTLPIQRSMPKNQQEEGFSSWGAGKKTGWVVLNLYTLGIPALMRRKKK